MESVLASRPLETDAGNCNFCSHVTGSTAWLSAKGSFSFKGLCDKVDDTLLVPEGGAAGSPTKVTCCKKWLKQGCESMRTCTSVSPPGSPKQA